MVPTADADAVERARSGISGATVGVPVLFAAELAAWRAFAGIESGAPYPRLPSRQEAVKIIAAKAGIETTPHSRCCNFATLGSRRGVPLERIQLVLAHDSITTTGRALQVSPVVPPTGAEDT